MSIKDLLEYILPWLAGCLAILVVFLLFRLIADMFFVKKLARIRITDNSLIFALYQMAEQRKLTSLYVNNNMACINFPIDTHVTTTKKKYYDGKEEVVSKTETHTAKLTAANVIDFDKCGYQAIPKRELTTLMFLLHDQICELPHVSKITEHDSLSFDNTSLIVCNGKYGRQPHSWESAWIIHYKPVRPHATSLSNGRRLG